MIQIIITSLLSTAVGCVLGLIFMLCRLPLPAPPTFAGVCGVLGVYLGYRLFTILSTFFF
ncbi:MAG: DUF1427 family protein [bacterium]